MRHGFTTGSCAAAASKAATYMLLTGSRKENIEIITPAGIVYKAEILEIKREENSVSCAVRKDAGDDPDVTDGILIYTKVKLLSGYKGNGKPQIIIDGGEGIGRVTKIGLNQPVGSAAINDGPRRQIEKEVLDVCQMLDFIGSLRVVISAPEGIEVAKKTFNERLGIIGGISILGTSGIVEPMSQKAILDTIKVEMTQRKALEEDILVVTPGNYGQTFIENNYNYDLDKAIKISNFIGNSIDMAAELGFDAFCLVGHIGKLVKIAGGIMNTHSKEADCRMEILAAAALEAGCDREKVIEILKCISTDGALEIIDSLNARDRVMDIILKKIMYNLNKRAGGKMTMECMVFSNEAGVLCSTENVEKILNGR